jgi:hypothetical protein
MEKICIWLFYLNCMLMHGLTNFKSFKYFKHASQSDKLQIYFNSDGYTYMHATCFSLYVGHPQACQQRNHNIKMQ